MAAEHDSWLDGLGVDVDGVLQRAADAVAEAGASIGSMATSVVSGIPDSPNDADSSVEDASAGQVGTIGNTVAAVAQGVSTWAGEVKEAGSAAFASVSDAANEMADGVESTANSAIKTVSDFAGEVVDVAEGLAQSATAKASELYEQAKEAVEGSDLPYQFGGIQAPFEKSQEEAQTEGLLVAARSLGSAELADAKLIFGDSIDYSKVLVDGGSLASAGASRTLGNTVHLASNLFQPGTAETTTEGRRTLVHELTHVWQYQHQGWTYAPEAIWAQIKSAVSTGDRNGAYDWKSLAIKGVPWDEWNPEAQAEAVEQYNIALHKANDGTAKPADFDRLDVLAKYVRNVGSSATDSEGPRDPVFNCAVDMRGHVLVEQDGTWSCEWSWTYIGTTLYDSRDVCDEFLLLGNNGQILDRVTGARHDLSPGQTYLGSTQGKLKITGAASRWRLTIPYKDGYVGAASGSVAAFVPA